MSMLLKEVVFPVFVLSLVVLLLSIAFISWNAFQEHEQYLFVFAQAKEINKPQLCDTVRGDDEAIDCFAHFVQQGFEQCDGLEKAVHCYTALGIVKKDEEICHLPLLRQQLEFKNECMARIHIERYA